MTPIGSARCDGGGRMKQRATVVFWGVAAVGWLLAGWLATRLPY